MIVSTLTADRRLRTAATGLLVLLAACQSTPLRPGDHHLAQGAKQATANPAETSDSGIPSTVNTPMLPPRPRVAPKLETYSVVVSQVEISELLFAMARDAKLNVDVHPSIKGKVTLNAVEQTLPQILQRLSRQVDLRYELEGNTLVVMPDTPFIRHYTVDYVNMTRDSQANTSIATNISSTGGGGASSGGGQSTNNSTTRVVNTSNNRFWQSLVSNLNSLLAEPARSSGNGNGQSGSTSPSARGGNGGNGGNGGGSAGTGGSSSGSASSGSGGSSGAGASGGAQGGAGGQGGGQSDSGSGTSDLQSVTVNPETGIVSVRASSRQHEKVREYIDKVMNSARRQVLIEATIAEVQLSDQFQQGVNWSRVRLDGTGWSLAQQPQGVSTLAGGTVPGTGPGGIIFPLTGGNLPAGASSAGGQASSMAVFRYLNNTSQLGGIGFALSLLQSFGKVKVLSSPKISVLNNQTAVLKVVDNRVYFTIGVQVTPGSATTAPLVTYTSTANTVPVGFVMSVTPQIEESGGVTMNVRPTISRIVGYVNDPSPALAQNNVVSRIPEIQTREIESILKVHSGDVAVMGGLMQESIDDRQDAIPGASALPIFGNAFKYKNDSSNKTELAIFLRPVVIRDASMDGDYRGMKSLLPGADFFARDHAPVFPRAWSDDSSREPNRERAAGPAQR